MESNAHTLRLFIRFNQSDLMKVCIYSTDCIYRAVYTQKKKKSAYDTKFSRVGYL